MAFSSPITLTQSLKYQVASVTLPGIYNRIAPLNLNYCSEKLRLARNEIALYQVLIIDNSHASIYLGVRDILVLYLDTHMIPN